VRDYKRGVGAGAARHPSLGRAIGFYAKCAARMAIARQTAITQSHVESPSRRIFTIEAVSGYAGS
jgi:hypothetical protein